MLLSKVLFRPQIMRQCCASLQLNMKISGAPKGQEKFTLQTKDEKEKVEIEDALKIGDDLFEGSFKHRPVLTKEMAKMHKLPPQTTVPMKKSRAKKQPPQLIDDPELGLKFYRLALHDPILHDLMTTVRSRKRRDKDGQIVVEGRRLIRDALECELKMRALVFSNTEQVVLLKKEIAQAQETTQANLYKIAQHDLKMWSTLSTPPGILAIFDRPSPDGLPQIQSTSEEELLPITVICDNIREPNNLGSIIRTCAAIPCAQVIVMRGCCDPWDSKALRGGCGGHFRLPVMDNVNWEILSTSILPKYTDDVCVFVAENNLSKHKGQTRPIEYTDVEQTGAHNFLIIGGESHGVSEDAYQFLHSVGERGKCLYIPVAKGVDSLNVTSALTLLLYELRRYLQKPKYDDVPKSHSSFENQ